MLRHHIGKLEHRRRNPRELCARLASRCAARTATT
jgi:hypothetical protein